MLKSLETFRRLKRKILQMFLKYGALPLAFDRGEVQQVSPTLGADQLEAGLLAGALGIGLVFIFSVFLLPCTRFGNSWIIAYRRITALSHLLSSRREQLDLRSPWLELPEQLLQSVLPLTHLSSTSNVFEMKHVKVAHFVLQLKVDGREHVTQSSLRIWSRFSAAVLALLLRCRRSSWIRIHTRNHNAYRPYWSSSSSPSRW